MQPLGPLNAQQRREEAYARRFANATQVRSQPTFAGMNNGDDDRYPDRRGSFTKGLPHNNLGEVHPGAYMQLLSALRSGSPSAFEAVPLGGAPRARKLLNPQAGLAFDTEGFDAHTFAIPPAPRFDSAEMAAEMVELYWMALLRDVPYANFGTDPNVQAACDDLNKLADFTGPRDPSAGKVTPQTLFRCGLPGELEGPFISQFMLKNVPFGAQGWKQVMRSGKPGVDYLTSLEDWLHAQNGQTPVTTDEAYFDPAARYIVSGRELSQWVHIDVLFQAYFNALLIMDAPRSELRTPVGGGIEAAANPGNPYNLSLTQEGFGTFGGPGYITLLCEVATRALKAVWWNKWFVHRRLRPEVFAGRIHFQKAGAKDYGIHKQVLESEALARVGEKLKKNGNAFYLLPMAFPEGSPIHPAYGAGHATVAGACVTVLKALFNAIDPSLTILEPERVDPSDPTKLVPANDLKGKLTVEGELNKLAMNVANGRNIAGVHWRTDASASLRLGEQIAIGVMRDHKPMFNEAFNGWELNTFDGQRIIV